MRNEKHLAWAKAFRRKYAGSSPAAQSEKCLHVRILLTCLRLRKAGIISAYACLGPFGAVRVQRTHADGLPYRFPADFNKIKISPIHLTGHSYNFALSETQGTAKCIL